jgi:hypothetical protein
MQFKLLLSLFRAGTVEALAAKELLEQRFMVDPVVELGVIVAPH